VRGLKYITYGNHSGYGLAALAYARALRNAGVPVWWVPLFARNGRDAQWRAGDGLSALTIARHIETDATVRDLPALLDATREKPYDTVLVHTVPEKWPALVEAGKRNVGYTVWETDTLPAHWRPLLDLPDKVLVPCTMNRTVFVDGGVARPVVVVPHIRRHVWSHETAADGAALREQLGVPHDHFVFYSIAVWDPRKALADLIGVYSRAFCGDDKVSLVLKTSAVIDPLALERAAAPNVAARVRALQDAIAAETGRPPAHIAVLAADEVAGRVVDALHATGDCYVSLTHGEGWGIGAFDAATLGKPVLIAPFGGPADYLPADYPGFIDYRMEPVSGWVEGASFQPPQRWAQADPVDASRKMRDAVTRYLSLLEPAAVASERIVNRYAEPVVARELIAALDD
jgi:glycosyltransferase involved in cell wall biosynthesis